MSEKLIVSISKRFKLFKPPNRIGDILEHEKIEYLIIGIEKVSLFNSTLTVIYTCQNLSIEYDRKWAESIDDNIIEFSLEIDITREQAQYTRKENLVDIGQTFEYEDEYFRYSTYSDLEFDFTTLKVNVFVQPIAPMSTRETKRKLVDHKVKKIGLVLL